MTNFSNFATFWQTFQISLPKGPTSGRPNLREDNKDQQWPTMANEGQQRPNKGQQRPMKANPETTMRQEPFAIILELLHIFLVLFISKASTYCSLKT